MATFITSTTQSPIEGAKQKKRYVITSPGGTFNAGQGISMALTIFDFKNIFYLAPANGTTHAQMYTGLVAAIATEVANNPNGSWANLGYTVTDNGTSIDLEAKYGGSDAANVVFSGGISGGDMDGLGNIITPSSVGTAQINTITPNNITVDDIFTIATGTTTFSYTTVEGDTAIDIVTYMVDQINADRIANPNGDYGFNSYYQAIGTVYDGIVATNNGTYIELEGISNSALSLSSGVSFTQTSSAITTVEPTNINEVNIADTITQKELDYFLSFAKCDISLLWHDYYSKAKLGITCPNHEKIRLMLLDGYDFLLSCYSVDNSDCLSQEELRKMLNHIKELLNGPIK